MIDRYQTFKLDDHTMYQLFPFLKEAYSWKRYYLKRKIWDGSQVVRVKYQMSENDEVLFSDYSEGFLKAEHKKLLTLLPDINQNNPNSNA